ncbi:NFYB8, partial [Symbiodinium sp. KB8]
MAASAPPGGPAAESAGPDAEGIAPLVPIAIDAQREQDRLLPEANIVRIMKRALPDGTKVSKEAKAAVVEAASEFVAFVTQEGERCTAQNRARRALVWQLHVPETPDLLAAMRTLGLDQYHDVLLDYLIRHRE